ncbi:hypothetical protein LEN26_003040 [Aphanomyces euteiches]|uniref:PX domain-containing protein n=1 Tax=Aphanomyces euteiches TaxID=100861 RepID=A0A6G0WY62_9STRA|nr:hypothetical protein Ae201684_010437 [Aphanomyces euteiches]KAH9090138.1 hypothetical protein Ae201684P_014889 [Aphanomyces euteiches]KAH9124470.1 hypothetical protein AeMF1_004781 [Aphanomyces euteiches]KAH9138582.1 hypothetical protein AeRB84_017093 [Aphanomyces euteiches]KAH9158335.1 hypothetical protein LEN26_003040 [Aphanomyces euteiches]
MLDLLMAWCWAPASPPSHKLDKQGNEASRRIQLGPVYTESLQVEVVGTTITTNGSNKYTVYIIVVGVDGVKSTVLRRYSQFFQLNVQLSQQFGCTLNFPERVLFNNQSDAIVHHRQAALDAYLKEALENKDARSSHTLRTFLGIQSMGDPSYVGFEWTQRSGRF